MPSETIELRGHIIDSLILPKVLDEILSRGSQFKISEVKIGQNRADQSFARIEVQAEDAQKLDELMLRLRQHGAEVAEKRDADLAAAPEDGIFPADFYVTTSQQTFVRIKGHEYEVERPMIDSAIAFDATAKKARTVKFADVRRGDCIVVGHRGVRVVPLQRATSRADVFQFLNTPLSAERPKVGTIREIARELDSARKRAGKVLLVAGASIIHTGGAEYVEQLISWGYIDLLIAGNAMAVYDLESALFGTALGVDLKRGALADGGHENHLRAINMVRCAGGIARLVERGMLSSGIMHACVKKGTAFLLTGSIRDDGPLPEVITDSVAAQQLIRDKIEGTTLALLLGTMLQSFAVANLLPASVKTLVVDINPAAVAKLTDQQTFQALGLVTDVEPFLRELVNCLQALRGKN
ncbi:MAG: TIGR00300 family protein [Verrucomicrobia bacterium]|nr:TIGR00300 family protein [Verrucomicrobiota bacterium]